MFSCKKYFPKFLWKLFCLLIGNDEKFTSLKKTEYVSYIFCQGSYEMSEVEILESL